MNPEALGAADGPADRLRRLVPSVVRADLRHRTGLTVPGDLAHRPSPPTPAPGEHTGPPDFALLGDDDAGSRWWLSLVTDHPDVAPGHATDAAAQFFAPYCTQPFGPAEVAAFHAWFPRRPGRIVGYWSSEALAQPWTVPLLARAAPRALLVFVVRDPVERLLDGLDRTVDARPLHPGSYLSDAVERGFYAEQLGRLLAAFPTDQVRVLQYERCVADPVGPLARTFEFLGVDPGHRSRPMDPPAPRTGRAAGCLDPATLARLEELYAADVAALGGLVPDLDLALWPNFAPGH